MSAIYDWVKIIMFPDGSLKKISVLIYLLLFFFASFFSLADLMLRSADILKLWADTLWLLLNILLDSI
jgi:hypothetical protein